MSSITSPEWTDFLTKIKEAKGALGNPETLWYRGHPNSNYYLLASLNRFENGLEKEKYLFHSFQKFSEKLLKRRESEWETLFYMQHYHIPTRLLDWSETFGIALFFAAHYNENHHAGADAAIYLLNPEALNKISNVNKVYRIPEEEEYFPYSKIYWDHRPFSPSAPIAIEPIFINDRMLAQRGMFTVHDDSIDPIEDKFPDAVKKVILPNQQISAAMEFLDLSNTTQYTVFPDLAGIAGFLMRTSELKHRW